MSGAGRSVPGGAAGSCGGLCPGSWGHCSARPFPAVFPANFIRLLCLPRPGPAWHCRAPRERELRRVPPLRTWPVPERAGSLPTPTTRVSSPSRQSPGRRPSPARGALPAAAERTSRGAAPRNGSGPEPAVLALGTRHLLWVVAVALLWR